MVIDVDIEINQLHENSINITISESNLMISKPESRYKELIDWKKKKGFLVH